jgi:hypothetical protein
MGNNKAIGLASFLITAAAWVVLYLSGYGLPPRIDPGPHRVLGQRVADETVKLLGSGGRVVLIRRDTTAFKYPAVDAQLKGFFQALHKAGVRIAVTNVIKLDPLRLVSLPDADFFQILKKASASDVIVSFVGPPNLTSDHAAKLGDHRPHVVAVCTGEMPRHLNLKRLFEDKLLHSAVISRRVFPANPPASNDAGKWFDYLHAVITPSNVSELPEPLAAAP